MRPQPYRTAGNLAGGGEQIFFCKTYCDEARSGIGMIFSNFS